MSAYTVKQVAEILGYSTNSIYTFLKEKRIKGIRVGKGRFRIPQSELDRLLLTKETKTLTPERYGLPLEAVPGITQALPTGVIEAPRETVISPNFATVAHRVEVPSLFDWFVGIGSIILGLAMFLFSRVYEEFSFEQFLPIMPAIRMTLIAGGFGILLTDIVSRKTSMWHHMFHWALVFAYACYTFILFRTGNWEGVVIFGALTVTLTITFFTGIGGIAGFALYVVGLLALLPVVAVLAPAQSTLLPLLSFVPLPGEFVSYVWIALVLGIACIIWLGYMRDKRVFWIGMMGVSILLIALSVHYAANLAWGRSLFVLITAMLSLFVPVWQSLTFTHKRDRAFIFSAFGTLLLVYVLVVGVLRVMQTNVMEFASRELTNKVSYGRSIIESTLMTARTSLSSAATNPLLVSVEQTGEKDEMLSFVRALFEGTSLFRRVVLLADDGELLAMYPLAATDSANFAQSDYFIRATTTKKIVTSDIYESSTGDSRQKAVVIAVPVINSKNKVVGVIAGSLDLSNLGNKLQQMASTQNGEYVIVIDSLGKRLIHPDTTQIGSTVETTDPIRQGLSGAQGVIEGYNSDNIRSIVAYSGINADTGWAIAVKAPVTQILQATNAASITIFSVTIVSIFVIAVFLLSHRTKVAVNEPVIEVASLAKPSPALQEAAKIKRKRVSVPEDTS
jgi:excisionase family DNA binding protein